MSFTNRRIHERIEGQGGAAGQIAPKTAFVKHRVKEQIEGSQEPFAEPQPDIATDRKLLELMVSEPYIEQAFESYVESPSAENLKKLLLFDALQQPNELAFPDVTLADIAGFYNMLDLVPELKLTPQMDRRSIKDKELSRIMLLFKEDGRFGYAHFGYETTPAIVKQTLFNHYFSQQQASPEGNLELSQLLLEPLGPQDFRVYRGAKLLQRGEAEAAMRVLEVAADAGERGLRASVNQRFLMAQAAIALNNPSIAAKALAALKTHGMPAARIEKSLGQLYLQQEITRTGRNYLFELNSATLAELGTETEIGELPDDVLNLIYRAFIEKPIKSDSFALKKLELQKLTGRAYIDDLIDYIEECGSQELVSAGFSLMPEAQLKEFEYKVSSAPKVQARLTDNHKRVLAGVCLECHEHKRAANYLSQLSSPTEEDTLKLGNALVLSGNYELAELFKLLDPIADSLTPFLSLSMANFAFEQGDFGAAVKHYRGFLAKDSSPLALKRYAVANYKLKAYAEANDAFELLSQEHLGQDELFPRLATLFQLSITGEASYSQVLRFADSVNIQGGAPYYYIIGHSQLEEKERELSLESLLKAKAALDPANLGLAEAISRSIVRAYEELGTPEQGLLELETLQLACPDDPAVALKLARLLAQDEGQAKRAETLYCRIIESSKELAPEAKLGLLETYCVRGDPRAPALFAEVAAKDRLSYAQAQALVGAYEGVKGLLPPAQSKMLLLEVVRHATLTGQPLNVLQQLDTLIPEAELAQFQPEPNAWVLEGFYKTLYEQAHVFGSKLNKVLFMLDKPQEVVPSCPDLS
jgi:hypothetical protein